MRLRKINGGYEPNDVDAILFETFKELQQNEDLINSLLNENAELKDKVEKFQKLEEYVDENLTIMMEQVDSMKTEANFDVQLLLIESENKALEVLNEALVQVEKALSEVESSKKLVAFLKHKLRILLESQLELLDRANEV